MTPDFANTPFQTARIVADCWREVLALAVVDPNRNFFELGGTSVHAIMLHTKLSERLPNYGFTVMTIFQHPTIAEFLEAIAPPAGGSSSLAMSAGDRTAATSPPLALVRGPAPLSAQERAERQQQRIASGQPPWAGARS